MLQAFGVRDRSIHTVSKDHRHGEPSTQCRLHCLVEAIIAGDVGNPWDKSGDVDESWEHLREVRAFGVNVRDVEQLGTFDIGNERNGEIDCHPPRAVAFAGVAYWTAVIVLGWEVDVHADQVVH